MSCSVWTPAAIEHLIVTVALCVVGIWAGIRILKSFL